MERLLQETGYTYNVRRSQRARYAQIKITPSGVVTVVIPQRFSLKHIPEILRAHQDWINKQLALIRCNYNPDTDSNRPTKIILNAIAEEWSVTYQNPGAVNQGRRLKEHSPSRQLIVKAANHEDITRHLSGWLNKKARALLTEQVRDIGLQTNLLCNGVSIRNQRTRWGSCSVKKHLSLNRNLIFLPERSMRYLILHELCHTVYMNHSQRFWHLVEQFEPDYKRLDKSLTIAKGLIPNWALPGS